MARSNRNTATALAGLAALTMLMGRKSEGGGKVPVEDRAHLDPNVQGPVDPETLVDSSGTPRSMDYFGEAELAPRGQTNFTPAPARPRSAPARRVRTESPVPVRRVRTESPVPVRRVRTESPVPVRRVAVPPAVGASEAEQEMDYSGQDIPTFRKGGKVNSVSRRADGIAARGKTKCKVY